MNKIFTVIDVGGSVGGWSKNVVDVIVDLNPTTFDSGDIKIFKFDITVDKEWQQLERYVEKYGKFDFSICTHTLEDIINPLLVSQKLETISKGGYLAFPSKFREFSFIESDVYRGFIHHRWIFDIHDDILTAYPKLGFLERDPRSDSIANPSDSVQDLHLIWENRVDLKIINGGYMGPNVMSVLGYYDPLFNS